MRSKVILHLEMLHFLDFLIFFILSLVASSSSLKPTASLPTTVSYQQGIITNLSILKCY